jgi:hypothetical protein
MFNVPLKLNDSMPNLYFSIHCNREHIDTMETGKTLSRNFDEGLFEEETEQSTKKSASAKKRKASLLLSSSTSFSISLRKTIRAQLYPDKDRELDS